MPLLITLVRFGNNLEVYIVITLQFRYICGTKLLYSINSHLKHVATATDNSTGILKFINTVDD